MKQRADNAKLPPPRQPPLEMVLRRAGAVPMQPGDRQSSADHRPL